MSNTNEDYVQIGMDGTDEELSDRLSHLNTLQNLESTNRTLKESLKKSERNFYLLMLAFIACVIGVVVLTATFAQYPKTQYIATSNNEAICEVLPQQNPNYTNESVTVFAQQAVTSLYTFNFLDADQRISDALGRYYTNNGRNSVSRALANAGLLDSIKRNAKSIRGYASTAPIIIEAGEGYWIVQFDFTLEVYGASASPEDSRQRRVTAKVVPVTKSHTNTSGLGVESIQTTGL